MLMEYVTAKTNLLDSMRDGNWLALFWESWHGSVGWVLYKSPEGFIEFVDKVLFAYYFPDPDETERKELADILSDSSFNILDRIKRFMSRLEVIFKNIPQHDTFHGPFTYDELVVNDYYNNWFKEFLEDGGLPITALSADHKLAEEFLISIRDEPSIWPWEVKSNVETAKK